MPPTAEHSSASLWGLLYTGAASDTALQTAISRTFDEARAKLKCLGPQVEPLASKVREWRDELTRYARTINYGEANSVLLRLKCLLAEIREQAESDRLLVESGKKPAAKVERAEPKSKQPNRVASAQTSVEDEESMADDDLEWAKLYQNTVVGHSKATARSAPKFVQAKQAYVPPTPEEEWRDQQREMANQCDNGIKFGSHGVDQQAVIQRLHLAPGDSITEQYREGPENSHLRIMKSSHGEQFWTLG